MDVNGLYLRAPNRVSVVRYQTLFRLTWQNTERVNSRDLDDINDLHNLQESESEDTLESQSDSEMGDTGWGEGHIQVELEMQSVPLLVLHAPVEYRPSETQTL